VSFDSCDCGFIDWYIFLLLDCLTGDRKMKSTQDMQFGSLLIEDLEFNGLVLLRRVSTPWIKWAKWAPTKGYYKRFYCIKFYFKMLYCILGMYDRTSKCVVWTLFIYTTWEILNSALSFSFERNIKSRLFC